MEFDASSVVDKRKSDRKEKMWWKISATQRGGQRGWVHEDWERGREDEFTRKKKLHKSYNKLNSYWVTNKYLKWAKVWSA